MSTYTVAGVTYDSTTGRPISFDDSYTGPKNALVGEITSDAGVKYGVYADYNQEHNEVQDSSGNVVANNISTINTGTVNVNSSVFNANDVQKVQNIMKTAEESNNIKPAATGLSNIPPAEGNADIEGVGKINPDFGQPADPSTWPNGTTFEFPEFGRVDKILQQLSLRNLKYPIDADYGNTQDYMQINQFSYKPPSEGIFFPEGGMKQGFKQGVKSITGGVPSGTPKEKAIGLVKLPMPNSLADSNTVSWGPDQLNALTAAATSAAMGASGDALQAILEFAKGAGTRGLGQNLQLAGTKISQGVGNILSAMGAAGNELNEADKSNLNLLGRTVIGSQLLNLLQFQVSPESILARGAGVVPNNNLALLFNAPTLRKFSFSWRMSPRSREEAIRINNILRFFKQGMAPKKSNESLSGGASFFLGTPNIFDIHFKTAKTKDYQILDRNDSVLRIKTCALVGTSVNYTPEGMWNAYEKGQPTAITLSLEFNELEPIFDTDYDNNYFNYDPQRTDLLPVPTDAVGY